MLENRFYPGREKRVKDRDNERSRLNSKLKHHLVGGHPRTANNRAVTAKERSRHKNAGKNGPNGRWPIGPFLRQVPIGDRDRSFAVTALSEAVATITAVITKVSFSNGAAQQGWD